MSFSAEPVDGCRHDRAPLKRLGKIHHGRTGKCVYVLLCTECGFTVTTEQLRRLRGVPPRDAAARRAPAWAPRTTWRPLG
ncbi:MAG: hypothetical protein FJ288_04905 [Planctomycetes bacterium]|nr:hypothetical protein [Planctomycetota bacterium]